MVPTFVRCQPVSHLCQQELQHLVLVGLRNDDILLKADLRDVAAHVTARCFCVAPVDEGLLLADMPNMFRLQQAPHNGKVVPWQHMAQPLGQSAQSELLSGPAHANSTKHT